MEKYSRVLIIIFFLCLINLGLSIFIISKNDVRQETATTPIVLTKLSPSPIASSRPLPITDSDIKSDLTLIKAEIRAIREILGVTGSFEELSNLIKSMNNNQIEP